jgi:hypothetical protein
MSDELTARVAANAGAARVAIDGEAAARVARAVSPAVERFAAANLALAMEVEPATFVAVQRKDVDR